MDWKKSIRAQALALLAATVGACGGGSSGGDGVSAINAAGRLFYESPAVRTSATSCRYDFDNPVTRPVRRAPVELRDSNGALLASTTTDDTGAYRFSSVAANTSVTLRVRSQIVQSGAQSWAVYVRDNTEPGLALTNKPVYAVEFGTFNTGSADITNRDFVASTGWGGTRYTGTRAAAPLAILDALLDGYLLVASADAEFDMGRLDAFWSPDNTITGDNDFDAGRLVTAFYSSNPDDDSSRNPSLFLPGDAVGRFPGESLIDTDEFDRSVIHHEWAHFFEDELARSDSIGGAHRIPGEIEPRVAFGEGWGYGVAAIANAHAGDVNGARLCDIASPTGSSFPFDVETPASFIRGTPGFFNEVSVASLLYDLFDPANEPELIGPPDNPTPVDGGELGFGPIYAAMTGPQSITPAFTTLFSFAAELGDALNQTDLDFLTSLLRRENVDTGLLDIWASGQTTLPAGWRDILPVYTDLPTDGSVLRVCANNDLDAFVPPDGNKPGEWRYLRFTTDAASSWRVFAEADPAPPPAPPSDPAGVADISDPDMWMYRIGDLINICPGIDCLDTGSGVSADPNSETMDTALLEADTYVIAFNEYVYGRDDIASNFPDRMCFNITANPR